MQKEKEKKTYLNSISIGFQAFHLNFTTAIGRQALNILT